MGSLTSRQNAGVEEVDISSNHAYKYPPRSGNYFGSHFIMGGERFDTPQPEAYLFGENADLNFLGSKPTPFPYPPPQVNEPTKTLKSLVNIRKESLRFVRVSNAPLKVSPVENKPLEPKIHDPEETEKGVNIEFVFDCDCRCAITIYYLCQEEITATGVIYLSTNPSLTSETYHYKKGAGQVFCQPGHLCYPGAFLEDQLCYNPDREIIPVAIHCVAEEPVDEPHQSHTTIAVIDRHSDGSFGLRALKQKLYVDGLSYLLQEIYGIENKNSESNKGSVDTDTEDNGSECVICMCDGRDTLILPCRHLCLCNSCADSLRYQANNCPICRAPFRALLQIRALQKSATASITAPATTEGPFGAIPAGYEAVSLIEALNGPSNTLRPVVNSPLEPAAGTPDTEVSPAAQAAEALNRSGLDSKGPARPGEIREKGGSPSSEDLNLAPEFRMSVLLNRDQEGSNPASKENSGRNSPLLPPSKRPSKKDKISSRSRDTVLVVNETVENCEQSDGEPDSEAEKMSPLLDASTSTDPIAPSSPRGDKLSPLPPSPPHPGSLLAQVPAPTAADDSDYYTPDDQGPGGLLDADKPETRPGAPSISAGNTPVRAPGTPLSAATSHRSSGDSFSSSSSTRQLLPPVIITNNGTAGTHTAPEASISLQDVAMV